MTRRTPVRRVSAKRSREVAKYRKLRKKFLSTHFFCQKCDYAIATPLRDLHHFYGKVNGLLFYEPGFRMLCRECHTWVETHRNEAVKLGLRAPDNLFNRPSLVIPK